LYFFAKIKKNDYNISVFYKKYKKMKYYNLEKFLKNIVVFSNNDLKLLDDKYNSAKVNSWLDS